VYNRETNDAVIQSGEKYLTALNNHIRMKQQLLFDSKDAASRRIKGFFADLGFATG
jgi:hypothetical protein